MVHYFSKEQDSRLKISVVEDILIGNRLKFESGSGVFSVGKVDNGTRLLIENAELKACQKILDLGCGWGPVGISVAKKFPSCEVVMSDINKRAVMLARRNIKANDIENARAEQGDMYDNVKDDFDVILINPPQNAGRDACFSMIDGAYKHLVKGGTLQIVARHKKGGKVLSDKMGHVFGNVRDIGKGSGFRIYLSEK